MKAYLAEYAGFPAAKKDGPELLPGTELVAANNLNHAARKAMELEPTHGELIGLKKTDKVII